MSKTQPDTSPTPKPQRRTARPATATTAAVTQSTTKPPARLDQLEQMLTSASGASIAEMADATGWKQHSVRGAMAGALKKRGLTISSEKLHGVRRYRAEKPA